MRWGEIAPEAALAKARDESLRKSGVLERAVKHIFEGLALADPAQAAQLLGKLGDSTEASDAEVLWGLEGTAVRWAERDATAATAWGLAQTDPDAQRKVLRAIPYGILLKKGVSAANQWWQTLPEHLRSAGFSHAALAINENPDGNSIELNDLLQILGDGAKAGLRDTGIERSAAIRFGSTEPVAGLEFFSGLQQPDRERYQNLMVVANVGMNSHREKLDAWVAAQPPSPLRDAVLEAQAEWMTRRKAPGREALAAQIQSPDARQRVEALMSGGR
jgi:plasmid stabilization system protein ParE